MRTRQFMWLSAPLLGLALVFGFLVADINAQTPTPSAPPAQQEGTPQPSPGTPAPGATDRGAAPQGTTPETRAPQAPGYPAPNVNVDNRSETRSDAPSGTILGVDATVALVIGAVLLVVVILAVVAMSKRSDEVVDRRSV